MKYGYNQAGELTSYKTPDITGTYTYNGTGLETSRTHNGNTTNLVWDQNQSIPLLIFDGQNFIIYGPGGLPIEEVAPGSSSGLPLYFHHDQQGSTTMLTGENTGVGATALYSPAEGVTYTPYGISSTSNPIGKVSGPLANMGYDGQYTDPDTGLINLRARQYDPATAQFITRDPLNVVTRAAYTYADDNPLNNADPSGLDCGPLDPGGCINDAVGGLASGAKATVKFIGHNWRPIASATLDGLTIAGCAAPGIDAGCGWYIAGNAAAQSTLIATGPGSTRTKAGLIGATLLLGQFSALGAGATETEAELEALNTGYTPGRWVKPFLAATGAAPNVGLDAANLGTYPWDAGNPLCP